MATLTNTEKLWLRQQVARLANENGVPISWVKSEIDNAMQTIENWWELAATKTALSSAIDAGTAFSFTVPQKKFLVKFWLEQKAGRE